MQIDKYFSTPYEGYFEILFSINKKRIYKKVHQVVAERS